MNFPDFTSPEDRPFLLATAAFLLLLSATAGALHASIENSRERRIFHELAQSGADPAGDHSHPQRPAICGGPQAAMAGPRTCPAAPAGGSVCTPGRPGCENYAEALD